MSDAIIPLILLVYIVWKEAFTSFVINKLINKNMSRDFFAYKQADALESIEKANPQPRFVDEIEEY